MATKNNNLSDYKKDTLPNVSNLKFGIVVSQWNKEITDGLFNGAYSTLIDCGVLEENIKKLEVPGSFELIFGTKILSRKDVDAIIFGTHDEFAAAPLLKKAVDQGVGDG